MHGAVLWQVRPLLRLKAKAVGQPMIVAGLVVVLCLSRVADFSSHMVTWPTVKALGLWVRACRQEASIRRKSQNVVLDHL